MARKLRRLTFATLAAAMIAAAMIGPMTLVPVQVASAGLDPNANCLGANLAPVLYDATQGLVQCTINPGVTKVKVQVWGAEGGWVRRQALPKDSYGGQGGYATATISVTPGQIATIQGGQKGGNSSCPTLPVGICAGAGGGGASIFQYQAGTWDTIVGGGGGGASGCEDGGAGGGVTYLPNGQGVDGWINNCPAGWGGQGGQMGRGGDSVYPAQKGGSGYGGPGGYGGDVVAPYGVVLMPGAYGGSGFYGGGGGGKGSCFNNAPLYCFISGGGGGGGAGGGAGGYFGGGGGGGSYPPFINGPFNYDNGKILVSNATPGAQPLPNGCDIMGTPDSDHLPGTPLAQKTCAGGGDDQATGDERDDDLYGGPGADDLSGDRGNDLLQGGSGLDHLSGGAGYDVCRGGTGIDEADSSCEVVVSA